MMPKREDRIRENANLAASTVFKVRISKGFIDATFGEGFLVEVWDFRTQRLVHGERFKELEKARRRQQEIKSDIDSMNLERFQQAYVSRNPRG
jgi:hypothetical protein